MCGIFPQQHMELETYHCPAIFMLETHLHFFLSVAQHHDRTCHYIYLGKSLHAVTAIQETCVVSLMYYIRVEGTAVCCF